MNKTMTLRSTLRLSALTLAATAALVTPLNAPGRAPYVPPRREDGPRTGVSDAPPKTKPLL